MEGRNPKETCSADAPLWAAVERVQPYALGLLIVAGLIFEVFVHYCLKISIVYTHFYYLIIVIAGLWYGTRAIWVALFFGGFQVATSYLLAGFLAPDSVLRALMLVIVAFVVGAIVDRMNCYYRTVEEQNRDLREMNGQLAASESAYQTANRKLNLLSSVTRHDIRNQLTALLTYLELARMHVADPDALGFMSRGQAAAHAIERQIEFTRNYEEIGVRAPAWQDTGAIGERLKSRILTGDITVSVRASGVFVYADPLFEKVFENLADNTLRHGGRVSRVTISASLAESGDLVLAYEDDGVGIPDTDKERIFVKGFGKNTGLGMFLSREILSITGLSIREAGTYGNGVRFEILVPPGKYRISGTGGP